MTSVPLGLPAALNNHQPLPTRPLLSCSLEQVACALAPPLRQPEEMHLNSQSMPKYAPPQFLVDCQLTWILFTDYPAANTTHATRLKLSCRCFLHGRISWQEYARIHLENP